MNDLVDAPHSDRASAALRYLFAAVFVAACLYNLELGVRVAGVFLVGLVSYQGLRGRVPLAGWFWETRGFLTGAAALAVCIPVGALGLVMIFDPTLIVAQVRQGHALSLFG